MGEEFQQLYFSHDINASDDFKILNLISDFNWYGYGIFWRIIELLHKNGNRLPKEEVKSIVKIFNFDEKTTYAILNNYNLFSEKEGIYSSIRVGKNLSQMADKRIQKINAINKRWAMQGEKDNLAEFYKNEYKKVFGESPTLQKPEVKALWDISQNNEDFKEKLPIVFERLSKIKFSDDINYQPLSSWLLEKNHYSKVANGEFSKKKMDEIKKSLYSSFKPEEYKEPTEEEKAEMEEKMKHTRKMLEEKLSKKQANNDSEAENGNK